MDYKSKLLQTVPTMNGWCDPSKANHIFDTVYGQNPKLCVELGVFAGRSLIAFALALAKRSDKRHVVYGVDTWAAAPAMDNNDAVNASWWREQNYKAIKGECERVCSELGVSEYVRLRQMSTLDAYYDIEGEVDVLHIDGNHSRWDSVRDVTMWVDRVRDGGIVYFDDEDWGTTQNAQELLLMKCDKIDEIKTSNVCGVYQKRAGKRN